MYVDMTADYKPFPVAEDKTVPIASRLLDGAATYELKIAAAFGGLAAGQFNLRRGYKMPSADIGGQIGPALDLARIVNLLNRFQPLEYGLTYLQFGIRSENARGIQFRRVRLVSILRHHLLNRDDGKRSSAIHARAFLHNYGARPAKTVRVLLVRY